MGRIILNIFSLIIFSMLLFCASVKAQDPFPEPGPVFRDDAIPRIDIIIPEASINAILDPANAESDFHYQADFIFDNGVWRDTVENIGFRLRGNTSRHSQKKSFKISFNTYESGRKWQGLEKMNLNGEHNDPSVIRAKICWDLLYDFGVPASRSNHVDLFVNDEFFGIYINVEHVDEEFVNSRFGNNDGNLYKCLWPADLTYKGSNPDNYKFSSGDRRAYELRTNTEEDDYSDIAHFIDVLNNTDSEDMPCELDKVLNVDGMIRAIAFDILSGNWDGPLFNKNNFYLYKNTETGKFEYIPYDLDNTFGIDWFNITWATRNMYFWANTSEPRPLFYDLLSHPDHRDRLTYYMEYFIEKFYNEDYLFSEIDRMKAMMTNSIIADPFRPKDYGFSFQDFLNSYNTDLSANHVKYGLKPFITDRKNASLFQMDMWDIDPIITNVESYLDFNSASIHVKADVRDYDGLSGVELCYSQNASQHFCIEMEDKGNFPDEFPADGIFGGSIPVNDFSGNYAYYIRASDPGGNNSRYPVCEDFIYSFGTINDGLKINEFMADNDNTIKDNAGEYDDWIELFNSGNDAVFLGDKYLTDDASDPLKWRLPNWWLEPGHFVLFWADGDNETQGENHLGFKLSKSGEYVGVYDVVEGETVLLDGVEFGEQDGDVSLGRYPDGTGAFVFMQPTPGETNVPSAVSDTRQDNIRVYPNPVNELLRIDSEKPIDYIVILDVQGRELLYVNSIDNILNISTLKPGIYYIKIHMGDQIEVRKLVVR